MGALVESEASLLWRHGKCVSSICREKHFVFLPLPPLPRTSPQAVPAYIEKVNWGSLAESLEVYSLLDQIRDVCQEFPVEVSWLEAGGLVMWCDVM